MKKYGIMGGTFDPIHLGHLMIAEFVKESLNLDEVIFIPTGNPPHKDNYTLASHRYNMTSIAICDNKSFSISNIETNLKENSYSIDTIKKLKNEIQGEFYFIIGTDSLFMLETWKDLKGLSSLVEFACTIRPGYDSREEINKQIELLNCKYNTKVHIIDAPLYEISSTNIRNSVRDSKSIKYVVPDNVIKYINDNKLYKG